MACIGSFCIFFAVYDLLDEKARNFLLLAVILFLLFPSFIYWALSKQMYFILFGTISTLLPDGTFQVHNLLVEVGLAKLNLTACSIKKA